LSDPSPPGSATGWKTPRFLNRDGTSNVVPLGESRGWMKDVYHLLLTVRWSVFYGMVVGAYLVANAFFALLFTLAEGSIANARPGSFADAYSFSVQTMMTIGYGVMSPQTPIAHVLVAVEALAGLLGFGVATSLMFARFSRPQARVLFSNVAVISMRDGVPSLMFRLANERRSHIVEAELHVVLARNEVTVEGESVRRFYDLELARRRNATFALSWTAIHPIDARSPLHGQTAEQLRAANIEVIASVMGLDDTTLQTIHARSSYRFDELRFGARFHDIIVQLPDGRRAVDYACFHQVDMLPPRPETSGSSPLGLPEEPEAATSRAE
jgi:inward rectifier potassium channel